MYLLYSIALGMALALTFPYWLARMLRHGKYRAGLVQRLGLAPAALRKTAQNEKCIWVHAVSVGEVLAVSTLVEGLKGKFPGWRIVLSTTTLTGQELARKRFGADNVFYFPLDFTFAMRPYFERLRPKLVVIAETEFWPNFLRLARGRGARLAVVNARISDRSFPRYRMVRALLGDVLKNVDLFLTQSALDSERLVGIGVDAGRIQVAGNLKFDVDAPRQVPIVARLRSAIPTGSKVWVCGSTVEGEEEMLLAAFRHVLHEHPSSLLVLAPRHPERFPEVALLLEKCGIRCWRRSTWDGSALPGGVLLLDSIGELAALYELADFAFIGGSLVPRGGHNILEPAQFAVPILVGPSTENFRDILNHFERTQAVQRVSQGSLPVVLSQWMNDPQSTRALGQRGLAVYREQAGATLRTLSALEVLLWMPETMKAGYQKQQVGS